MAHRSRGGSGRTRLPLLLIAVNAGYAVLVLVLAVMPSPPRAPLEMSDKIGHSLAFGIQAVLLFGVFAPRLRRATAMAAAWAAATAYGVAIEVVQLLQPTRSFALADMIADAAGAAVAIALLAALRRIVERRTDRR